MKRTIGAALAALLTTSALAQVNVVPQIGVNTANLRQNTYTAAIKNVVPAASTTDFFCISAGSSKSVKLQKIELSGSGTLGSSPVFLMHNSILDTGTAAVVGTYGPVAYPLYSTNPAATAVVTAYNSTGGNPTIGGTATLFRSGQLMISPTATTTATQDRLVWRFGTADGFYNQQLIIPAGSTEQICMNLAASSLTAVLQGYMEWTEE